MVHIVWASDAYVQDHKTYCSAAKNLQSLLRYASLKKLKYSGLLRSALAKTPKIIRSSPVALAAACKNEKESG